MQFRRQRKRKKSRDFDCCIVDAIFDNSCFVAGASYGRRAPEVRDLRRYRDRVLRSSPQGRVFIKAYYRYGPYGARVIKGRPRLQRAARVALRPAVRHARRKLDE